MAGKIVGENVEAHLCAPSWDKGAQRHASDEDLAGTTRSEGQV